MAVRIGLVGCGHMGRFHAARLSEIPDIDFAGCFDIIPDKSRAIASEYKIENFGSLESMTAGS